MRETDASGDPTTDTAGEKRQPPRLSPKEVERIEGEEELEAFIEKPTQGDLSVISDEDVPGAPG